MPNLTRLDKRKFITLNKRERWEAERQSGGHESNTISSEKLPNEVDSSGGKQNKDPVNKPPHTHSVIECSTERPAESQSDKGNKPNSIVSEEFPTAAIDMEIREKRNFSNQTMDGDRF